MVLYIPICDDCGWSMDSTDPKRADAEFQNHMKNTEHNDMTMMVVEGKA